MKKIYLLEDSLVVSELLKHELEHEFNCIVVCFQNSKDLLDRIPDQPDLVILDYFIDISQKINGLTVMNQIKNMNDKLHVIIFSGQHNLKLAVQLIHAGAVDYIDKNEDTFLEDLNHSTQNVFQFIDTNDRLKNVHNKISFDRKQILAFGLLGFVIFVSLLVV